MMESALSLLAWSLIVAGSFFTLVGAVGLIRMPELYTRMHAASVIDTLGIGLMFAGLMVHSGFNQVSLKLFFILLLFFFTGPVVTHALAQAALHAGVKPELAEDRTGRLDEAGQAPAAETGRVP